MDRYKNRPADRHSAWRSWQPAICVHDQPGAAVPSTQVIGLDEVPQAIDAVREHAAACFYDHRTHLAWCDRADGHLRDPEQRPVTLNDRIDLGLALMLCGVTAPASTPSASGS